MLARPHPRVFDAGSAAHHKLKRGGSGAQGGVEGKGVGRRCGAEGRAGNQKGTTQSGAAVARGAAHGLSRPQQPAVCKAGAKKARAREAPDCPASPTSDQKRALGGS